MAMGCKHMSKILALDIGDQWIGSAISDALHITARPYQTVATNTLSDFIKTVTEKEKIEQIIVGNPITMRGTESQQTKKVHETYAQLQQQFQQLKWILWDERLSSKRAEDTKSARTKEEKIAAHSRAAAFILQSYLDYLSNFR
jgi:putative Holliday junction resolvase